MQEYQERYFKPIPPLTADQQARFWNLVEKGEPHECWPWKGQRQKAPRGDGEYGKFNGAGDPLSAHRVAFTLVKGPIPPGLSLDHLEALCKIGGICCNPDHLEPCTTEENSTRPFRSPDRLYSLTCNRGHLREFGRDKCRKCAIQFVKESHARQPEKYREMKRLQKQKERARRKELQRLSADLTAGIIDTLTPSEAR